MRNLNYFGLAVVGTAALFGIFTVFGGFYTVDQRDRAIVLRNGKLVSVAGPGLSLKMPWIDSVTKVSMETQHVRFTDVSSYSQDQQLAKLTISVNFHLSEKGVSDLYTQYGTMNEYATRILAPRVLSDSKIVFGQYNAVGAIQNRGKLNSDIQDSIIKGVGSGPVVIEAVNVENIDFSDSYEKSVEQRMLAEVEVQRLRQNAEREKVQAEIVVTQATAKADAVRQQAQADSEAIRLRGNAEADAIKARAAALALNTNLISLTQAEKWDGKLPQTMVPGGAVPFIDVAGKKE